MDFKILNISIHSIDTNRLVEDRSELSIDDKKIKSLATSIYDKGLLQPIKIIPVEKESSTTEYKLIYGKRRLAAYLFLYKKFGEKYNYIPAIVENDELTEVEIAMQLFAENQQREKEDELLYAHSVFVTLGMYINKYEKVDVKKRDIYLKEGLKAFKIYRSIKSSQKQGSINRVSQNIDIYNKVCDYLTEIEKTEKQLRRYADIVALRPDIKKIVQEKKITMKSSINMNKILNDKKSESEKIQDLITNASNYTQEDFQKEYKNITLDKKIDTIDCAEENNTVKVVKTNIKEMDNNIKKIIEETRGCCLRVINKKIERSAEMHLNKEITLIESITTILSLENLQMKFKN